MLRNWIVRVGATLATLALDATVAYARAGGGGGYSGGGGSSSSSSSSSSGGGGSSGAGSGEASLFDLILFAAVIAFFIYHRKRFKHGLSTSALNPGQQASAEQLASLRERDPDFDPEGFRQRVEQAFLKIQRAWSTQDLASVRGFMSDGLHERLSIQLREQVDLGYRNRMEAVQVLQARVVEARVHPHFDVVSVRLTARATDYREDLSSGREIFGTRRNEVFSEVWSFLRGSSSASSDSPGLLEGHCPNCSAPVDPARGWHCVACDSALESAPPDWVLSEITQDCEWRLASLTPRDETHGFKQIETRDPGLTLQQIEDRASVLFWRLMDSDRTGHIDELRSVARSGFLEQQASWLASTGGHYVGDCSVGAVTIHGVIPGKEWDLALAEVRWAGTPFKRLLGQTAQSTEERRLRRSLLVMARRSDATSRIGRCVVSAHCADCGAPDEGSLEGDCSFCGAPLNDGRDWLIERFLDMNESEATSLLAEASLADAPPATRAKHPISKDADPVADGSPSSAPAALELFAWSVQLVYADAHLDARERDQLTGMAAKLGIAHADRRALIRAAQYGRLEVERPKNASEATAWAETLRRLAEVDGQLTQQERRVLERLDPHA